MGAIITGYSLDPPTTPNLFTLTDISNGITSVIGDIRNYDKLKTIFTEAKPELVFHLAAQPIVRESYLSPRLTYETNVMGTVNLLECVRTADFPIKSVLNVTTDKVYENKEWKWGYRENEPLDGYDPYSNSKSCSELVTHSYINSFFNTGETAVSTARAGNVIGGGDFSIDRIIPDCIRAISDNVPLVIRNPDSIRPYQHVLEPLFAYLRIAQKQYENSQFSGFYNVGPDDSDCVRTLTLIKLFQNAYGGKPEFSIQIDTDAPHESHFLKLDCSKLKDTFGWKPRLTINRAVELTADWTKAWLSGGDYVSLMKKQVEDYINADCSNN
jgi:CDP-glucose 4,6-dehydratase